MCIYIHKYIVMYIVYYIYCSILLYIVDHIWYFKTVMFNSYIYKYCYNIKKYSYLFNYVTISFS